MTGSVGDAEDIVQDAFFGLTRARQAGTTITDPKAYLATAVTRPFDGWTVARPLPAAAVRGPGCRRPKGPGRQSSFSGFAEYGLDIGDWRFVQGFQGADRIRTALRRDDLDPVQPDGVGTVGGRVLKTPGAGARDRRAAG